MMAASVESIMAIVAKTPGGVTRDQLVECTGAPRTKIYNTLHALGDWICNPGGRKLYVGMGCITRRPSMMPKDRDPVRNPMGAGRHNVMFVPTCASCKHEKCWMETRESP